MVFKQIHAAIRIYFVVSEKVEPVIAIQIKNNLGNVSENCFQSNLKGQNYK